MGAHFMKIVTVYTLNSHLLTLKAPITTKVICSNVFEASSTNSVEEQSDLGPHSVTVYLFTYVNQYRHFQMQLICWRFKGKIICFVSEVSWRKMLFTFE